MNENCFLNSKNCLKIVSGHFAKAKLKGAACLWMFKVEDNLHRVDQSPTNTWDKMKGIAYPTH